MKWPYCLNCAIFPPNKKELHGEQCAVRLDLSQSALKPVLCGTLDLIGGRRCLFSYAGKWRASKNAFALSPDLPLKAGQFEPPAGLDLHPVFEDAGPDRWGRQIID